MGLVDLEANSLVDRGTQSNLINCGNVVFRLTIIHHLADWVGVIFSLETIQDLVKGVGFDAEGRKPNNLNAMFDGGRFGTYSFLCLAPREFLLGAGRLSMGAHLAGFGSTL